MKNKAELEAEFDKIIHVKKGIEETEIYHDRIKSFVFDVLLPAVLKEMMLEVLPSEYTSNPPETARDAYMNDLRKDIKQKAKEKFDISI